MTETEREEAEGRREDQSNNAAPRASRHMRVCLVCTILGALISRLQWWLANPIRTSGYIQKVSAAKEGATVRFLCQAELMRAFRFCQRNRAIFSSSANFQTCRFFSSSSTRPFGYQHKRPELAEVFSRIPWPKTPAEESEWVTAVRSAIWEGRSSGMSSLIFAQYD